MKSPAAVYRIFQRAEGAAPSVRAVVITLVGAAALLTTIGVIRVGRQHEVLRLGFELSRMSDRVGRMHEARRELELELATLTAPDRIRRLATQLGMAPVAPDRIRVVRLPVPPEPSATAPPEPQAPRRLEISQPVGEPAALAPEQTAEHMP
jgi:cell division protein FtsL